MGLEALWASVVLIATPVFDLAKAVVVQHVTRTCAETCAFSRVSQGFQRVSQVFALYGPYSALGYRCLLQCDLAKAVVVQHVTHT